VKDDCTMLADSPPQTDLTMLAYHEVGPYPCPSDEETP
jgi:hypothetical protein